MKTISLVFVAILLSTIVFAQDNIAPGNSVGKDKKTKKELRAEKIEQEYQFTKSLVDSMQFVLEADWLSNQWGSRVPVLSNINFIRVDSMEAVIQTGNNHTTGRNGLGGTTATGRITLYEVKKSDERHSLTIRMEVTTTIGFYSIMMDIMANGNATATITGMRPGKLVYFGKMIPLNESYAYKGSSY